ncbi:MAG: hypothetical protein DRN30_04240 [Thermoplasmata archaeon]|nr:MAG: hypothetical protein DRN30_04240 [Thermoplasmata archaeon]
MSKELQVGTSVFNYPENGDNAGWGEDATAWAEAVSDLLNTLQGPNTIPETTAVIVNNTTVATDIFGLAFNVSGGGVLQVTVEYVINRVYDSGASSTTESGVILGQYTGSDFVISQDGIGDTEVVVSVTSAGQFQYTSSNLTNQTSGTIKFKATTIDQ